MEKTGKVLWFTGLSGAGKTTLARPILAQLESKNILTFLLDGDEMRQSINKDLGYTEADRKENVRRSAEIAKLMRNKGAVVLCAIMSPTREMREMAKNIIGENNFYEIFVDANIEICQKRDTKGLYKKYEKGEIHDISGLDAPFEPPIAPFLTIDTHKYTIEECVERILSDSFTQIFADESRFRR